MTGTIIILILVAIVTTIVFLQWLGVIASRYPLKYFDKEKIVLERRQGLTKQFTWCDITAIFLNFCRFNMNNYSNFFFELADGTNVGFVIIEKVPNTSDVDTIPKKLYNFFFENFTEKRKHKYVASVLESLYDIFLESLNNKKLNVEKVDFSHPTRWIKSKERFFKMHCILFAFGILAMIYVGSNFRGWGPYLFPLPFLFLFVIVALREWRLNRLQKCLQSLKVGENQLIWKDEFGKSETKSFSEVRSFGLDKIKGFLEFSDGTKLRDLEKLRYWPLLRQHLLSKLEPSGKTSKTNQDTT